MTDSEAPKYMYTSTVTVNYVGEYVYIPSDTDDICCDPKVLYHVPSPSVSPSKMHQYARAYQYKGCKIKAVCAVANILQVAVSHCIIVVT